MMFELNKATEDLQFNLSKHGVDSIIPCQVKISMDVSGSFVGAHRRGLTQNLLNRLFPFGVIFDKDKEIDVYSFSHESESLGQYNINNFQNIITDMYSYPNYNGGTDFYPNLLQILKDSSESTASTNSVTVELTPEPKQGFFSKLFGSKAPKKEPEVVNIPNTNQVVDKELVFIITDGESSRTDVEKSLALLERYKNMSTFFVFISVGQENRFFKETFNDTPYTMYKHFTLAEINHIESISNDELYSMLLTNNNLTNWMNK